MLDGHSFLAIAISSLIAGYGGKYLSTKTGNKYRKIFHDPKLFPKEEVDKIVSEETAEKTKHIPAFLGVLERIIYAGGFLSGHAEIIAVLLGLKILPSLREHKGETKMVGWAVQNMYTVGALLSLVQAILIAGLIYPFINYLLFRFMPNVNIFYLTSR